MAIPATRQTNVEADKSFEEKLKLLSKSVGALKVEHSQDTDQVCREVRGKE